MRLCLFACLRFCVFAFLRPLYVYDYLPTQNDAVRFGHISIVRKLLAAGANGRIVNRYVVRTDDNHN